MMARVKQVQRVQFLKQINWEQSQKKKQEVKEVAQECQELVEDRPKR